MSDRSRSNASIRSGSRSADGVTPSADTDALIGRILGGGEDADECIEALIDAGLDEDDIQELVQDYGRRRHR